MIVDFHAHTNASDGTLSADELAALMQRRGVVRFAVTDHDTLESARMLARTANSICGVEINTTYRENEVHILGYGLGHSTELDELLHRNRAARRERASKMVCRLRAAGYELSDEHVAAEANGVIGRPHVAKALARQRLVPNFAAALDLLKLGNVGYVPSAHVTPHDAIEAVRAAHGVAVLAHPGRLDDFTIIDELAVAGLQGIEVFYPSHSPSQTAYFRERARALGLFMTAGSDFHDARYNGRSVGIDVEPEDIAPFLEALAIA